VLEALARHIRNKRLAASVRLKVAEIVSKMCQHHNTKEAAALRQVQDSVVPALIASASGSGADDASPAEIIASSMSSLGEALVVLPQRAVAKYGQKIASLALKRGREEQEKDPKVRRAAFFALERLFSSLTTSATDALSAESLGEIDALLRRSRVADPDAASRVLAGRAIEVLESKVLR